MTGIKNDPICLYTFDQYSGKGQRGSQWLSEAGKNLAVSVLIPEKLMFPIGAVAANKLISLSVLESIRHYCEEAMLKWPNDVRINQKKLAGILIEYLHNLNGTAHYCIGTGINVNQTDFSRIEQEATSLKTETGKELQITGVLHQLLIKLGNIMNNNREMDINERFNQSLEGMNKMWLVETERGNIRARLEEIDHDGRAVLMLSNGHLQPFHHGQVRLIRLC